MIDFQKSSFYSQKISVLVFQNGVLIFVIAVLVCEVGLPKNFLVGNLITSLMVMVLPRRGNTITKPKKILVIPLPTAKVRK